jgi:hypothetical protein
MSTYIDAPQRGLLSITGSDRFDFLQGLITNDILLLKKQPAIYSALLTPQGRFLFDFFIINGPNDSFLVDIAASRQDAFVRNISRFKLRRDVTISDVSDQYKVVVGLKNMLDNSILCYEDPRTTKIGFRAIVPYDFPKSSEPYEKYEKQRIFLCLPEAEIDMPVEKAIPLECRLDEFNAISFTKGCYLGQELTTRTKHRGEIHKKLFAISADRPLPEPGVSLMQNNKKVGTLRSVLGHHGIAMIRLTAFEDGLPIFCGDQFIQTN